MNKEGERHICNACQAECTLQGREYSDIFLQLMHMATISIPSKVHAHSNCVLPGMIDVVVPLLLLGSFHRPRQCTRDINQHI